VAAGVIQEFGLQRDGDTSPQRRMDGHDGHVLPGSAGAGDGPARVYVVPAQDAARPLQALDGGRGDGDVEEPLAQRARHGVGQGIHPGEGGGAVGAAEVVGLDRLLGVRR
jgi:hypothetical protein